MEGVGVDAFAGAGLGLGSYEEEAGWWLREGAGG